MDSFKKYRRTNIAEMRPYVPGEDISGISVSEEFTPEQGDMIARDPDNHSDQWLVKADYFKKNFSEIKTPDKKLSEEEILSRIAKVDYMDVGRKTTLCLITTVNGFEVIGKSGCVDPKNYNPEIGRPIAFQKAVDELWYLEGYLLQERLTPNQFNSIEVIPYENKPDDH